MKILIVDDSDFSRNTMKRFFMDMTDVRIAEAANGIEALEQHRTFRPDIIFLDVTMPHLDGAATLRILRKIDSQVLIIMATALAGQQYLCNEFIALGIDGVLMKPITKDAALNALLSAMRAKREVIA